jgi:hypothetical protein
MTPVAEVTPVKKSGRAPTPMVESTVPTDELALFADGDPRPVVSEAARSVPVSPTRQTATPFELELAPEGSGWDRAPLIESTPFSGANDELPFELLPDEPRAPTPVAAKDAAPDSPAMPVNIDDTLALTESQVLSILSAHSKDQPEELMRHAVQLNWSETPIDLQSVPWHDIFGEYHRYSVKVNQQGRCGYALRLGFFTQREAAEQVAAFLRSEYAQATVVETHAREQAAAGAPLAPRRVPHVAAAKPAAPIAQKAQVSPRKATLPTASAKAAEKPGRVVRNFWGKKIKVG